LTLVEDGINHKCKLNGALTPVDLHAKILVTEAVCKQTSDILWVEVLI
jgi:hypothetical protein